MTLSDALRSATISDILNSWTTLHVPKKYPSRTKKVVDNSSRTHVHCVSHINQPCGASQEQNMATLIRKNILKSGAGVYHIPGVLGTFTIGKQVLAEGASFPDTLTIDGLTVKDAPAPKVKMTAEERKAAAAAKTPEQKLQEQEARLAKQAANLAARKAKLAAVSGAPTA